MPRGVCTWLMIFGLLACVLGLVWSQGAIALGGAILFGLGLIIAIVETVRDTLG